MTIKSKKFLDQNLWPMLIVGSLTALVAFTFAVLKIADRNSADLVAPDYYAKGYNLKDIVASEKATQTTGWKVSIVPLSVESAGDLLLQINIVDRNNLPCDSIKGVCALYRPSDAGLDIPEADLTFIGAGRYIRPLPRTLERGLWNAVVDLQKDSNRYINQLSFKAP